MLLFLTLLKNLDLSREALAQIFSDRWLLKLLLEFVDPLFHSSGLVGRVRRFSNDLTNRFPSEEQSQINPYQPSKTFSLFLQARGHTALSLLFEYALAPIFQCTVALLILRRELPDQFIETSLPTAAFVEKAVAAYEVLKSRMSA